MTKQGPERNQTTVNELLTETANAKTLVYYLL